MDDLLSALLVLALLGVIGMSLFVDVLRYSPTLASKPQPVASPSANPPAANSPSAPSTPSAPNPAPYSGNGVPSGFHGPTSAPFVVGPSGPPPSN